ncbi:MAG: hypothetical protein A2889_05335 [Nitrospinae bacterium RIFCSPLOWO2_01_FULL_39_10]|nr:MAG: hypothetical protein A2889_05335 [Nitrospinae bacterium RIFCSPLOWO2_01_FULL_39_10]
MFYEQVFKKLNKKKVRYLVVGGIAVNLHGFPRVTGDLDIMLDLNDGKSVNGFVEVVKVLGFKPKIPVQVDDFAIPSKRKSWIEEKNMKVFSVYNPSQEIEHIDVLIENLIDFDKAYKTREIVNAGNLKVPVVSIDDLIKLKKISGRKRDEIDIAALKEIKIVKGEKK